MAVSSVSNVQNTFNNSSIAFKGKKNNDEKLTGGAGKAVASFFIPGLGQLLDGRKKAAAGIFGSYIAITAANRLNFKGIDASSFKVLYKVPFLAPILGALGLGHLVYRTVDAYRGDKNENIDSFEKTKQD